MPQVQIEYGEDEIQDLIASDVMKRFGVLVSSDDVCQGPLDGVWVATITKGTLDASKAD